MNAGQTPENHGQNGDVVAIEPVPVAEWASDLILRRPQQADVLVLPQRVRDGRGEYSQDDLMAVKELRAAGVRADWAHAAPEDRTVFSESSADVAVFVTLFVSHALADEAVVEVAKWLLRVVRQALTGRADHKPAKSVVIQVDRLVAEEQRLEIAACCGAAILIVDLVQPPNARSVPF
jgi:hypothetical protein